MERQLESGHSKQEDEQVQELFALWCLGEADALEDLLDLEHDWLDGMLDRSASGTILASRIAAADLSQELRLRLLTSPPPASLASRHELRSYLAAVLRNVSTDLLRGATAAKRGMGQVITAGRAWTDALEVEDDASSPATRADRMLSLEWLRDSMELLDPGDRDVVCWRVWEELSFRDIGARRGTTEDAARMRFHRALRRLATHIATSRGESA